MFEVSGDAVAGAGVEDGTAQALLTDREFRTAFFFFLNFAQFQQQKTSASYNLLQSTGTDNRVYTEMIRIDKKILEIKGYGLTTKVVSFL